jgi:hypothetical protein
MFGAGPVAARPPWDHPGSPFLPVEVAPGSDVGSAPRVWCSSAQTVTFRHAGNPTVAYVRLWVPGGGSWLRADEAGRVGLEPYRWYFSATYDAVYTVLETSGEQLAETNFRFQARRESGTPGMPGWGEVPAPDESDRVISIWRNDGASREVILKVTTTRTFEGGSGLEYRSRFFTDLGPNAVGVKAPGCPTSTRPDTESNRPGGSLKRSVRSPDR